MVPDSDVDVADDVTNVDESVEDDDKTPELVPSSALSRRRRPSSPSTSRSNPADVLSSKAELEVVDADVDGDADEKVLACRPPAKKLAALNANGFRAIDVSNTGERNAWRRPLAPACETGAGEGKIASYNQQQRVWGEARRAIVGGG